ncbi:plasmid stabilization protein [Streptomyces sp. NPDC001380]|uniref:plasmid stabilization protein n=1 Tax=Streptomyces sp. NPDC001380 TaxID=3364566 RepID=UPI003682E350
MPRGSSPKRERQYEHIKESARQRGEGEERAEEIAARTVNKERARSGEARTASGSSLRGPSPSRRGGQRSHGGGGGSRGGSGGPTKEQLYAEARKRDIKGRSTMTKDELRHALHR